MQFSSKFWFIIKDVKYLTTGEGILISDIARADTTLNEPKVPVPMVVATIVILFALWWLLSMVEHLMPYPSAKLVESLLL